MPFRLADSACMSPSPRSARDTRTQQTRAERVPTHPEAPGVAVFASYEEVETAIWAAAIRLAPEEAGPELTSVEPTDWLRIIAAHWAQIKPPLPANARRFADPAIAAAWDLAASAHIFGSYGGCGGTEEVMAAFGEADLIDDDAEHLGRLIDRSLVDLRKLVPQFAEHRSSWRERRAPAYAYRLAEAAADTGIYLLVLQAADCWPEEED